MKGGSAMEVGNAYSLISVLMPVYNARRYLAESIESILKQTYSNFELIIIDDGSTDRSTEIVNAYRLRDSRVKLFSRSKRGITAALNDGLRSALGIYIARMDADDISSPERFTKQVAFLEAYPEYVALGTGYIHVDTYGLFLATAPRLTNSQEIEDAFLFSTGGAIAHPTAMIRRWAIDKIGGYDPSMTAAQDVDLFLKLAEIGKLGNIPEPLLKYRNHVISIGATKREEQFRCICRAQENAQRRRGIRHTMDYAKLREDCFRYHLSPIAACWLYMKNAVRQGAMIVAIYHLANLIRAWRNNVRRSTA